MADRYVFADEAGNFDFSRNPGASRYFIICTISADECHVGDALLRLEKCKAQPHLRDDKRLYKMAWYLHFKHVAPRIASAADRLFVAASSLGTKKARGASRACRWRTTARGRSSASGSATTSARIS